MKTIILYLTLTALMITKALSNTPVNFILYNPEDSIDINQSNNSSGEIENEENGDSVNIKINNKRISIKEDKVTITDEKKNKYYSYEKRKKHLRKNFDGHLEGIEIGLANFLDADYELVRREEELFMDLNTGKSFRLSITPEDQSFGLLSNRIGLVTGLNFEFVEYHFDNNNNINKNIQTGIIEELNYTDLGISLKKSKLSTGYINIPILLEIQPFSKKSYIAGGIVGGLKFYSWTKVVYTEDGEKRKEKEKGDYNINPLRYGYIIKMGYNDFGIYAIYHPVRFFEKNRGPELYPFSVGISLNFD